MDNGATTLNLPGASTGDADPKLNLPGTSTGDDGSALNFPEASADLAAKCLILPVPARLQLPKTRTGTGFPKHASRTSGTRPEISKRRFGRCQKVCPACKRKKRALT